MNIIGTISHIDDKVNSKGIDYQTIWLSHPNDKTPVPVQFKGDRCNQILKYKVGSEVSVDFNINTNVKFNDRGEKHKVNINLYGIMINPL